MSESGDERPVRTPRPCPVCSKMSVTAFHPFCSKRCSDVDLNRWLGGVYRIPTNESPNDPQPPKEDGGED
jgi:endogenous inhibitor of DNA gyrase (YacG/DUF329 family)